MHNQLHQLQDVLAYILSNSDPPAPFLEIAAPEAPQPFSYGYAYTAPSPPSSPIRISASGLAQSSPRSSRPSSASTHKRFPAPLPFTRLVGGTSSARPVVDLGTAGRERDRKRRLDPASAPVLVDSHQGRGEVIWTKWNYVRDRCVFKPLSLVPHPLIFVQLGRYERETSPIRGVYLRLSDMGLHGPRVFAGNLERRRCSQVTGGLYRVVRMRPTRCRYARIT